MKRSTFLLIAAIIAALFGSMMLFVPYKAAEGFGMDSTLQTQLLLRSLGGMVLCSGILNFLVRNQKDSQALKAILIFNVAFHTLSMLNDLYGVNLGILAFDKLIPGIVAHLFIGTGSLLYLLKIKPTES
jgi:uncharacterized membrane protein